MNKQTTILFSEGIGAFAFSVTSAFITYFYAENSRLSSSGFGAVSIGSNPKLYVLFAMILFTWIGMIIGGVVGFYIVFDKSSKKIPSSLGLISGLILFFVLYLSFKLKQEISFGFVITIFAMSIILSYLCGITTYFLTEYLEKINFARFGQIVMTLVALVLPLIIFVVTPLIYLEDRNNFLKTFIESFGSVIIVIPPMLFIFVVVLIFSDLSRKKTKF